MGTASRPSYPEVLEAAWRAHLAPRAPGAPTVVSLFAGYGGSSLGYSMAGYRELLAVEWDANAVATFRLNFPAVPVYHGDIAQLSVDEALRLAGLRPRELAVLDGSPPWQGFSTAGKRRLHDPRNGLFREYVRLLRGLRPRAFVMENVPGLVAGKMRLVFAETLRELKESGYRVSARLLDAAYFDVPQRRRRLIFVGVRDDLGVDPSHPRAASAPRTVREALLADGHGYFTSGFNAGERVPFGAPAPTLMRDGIGGSGRTQFRLRTPASSALAAYVPAPAVTGKAAAIGFALCPGQRGGDAGGGWRDTARPGLDAPAPTVLKEAALWKRYPKLIHPVEDRGVSIGELRRLHSFPDEFAFPLAWVDAWAAIGNSVPTLFMRAIAAHVRQHILESPREPGGERPAAEAGTQEGAGGIRGTPTR